MPAPKVPSKLTVDFSSVEDRREGGGRSAHVPPGDYLAQVLGVELRSKKDDEGSKYLSWKLGIVKPEKYKSAGLIYFVTSLKPEALWNLRNFLEDLGIKVPKSSVNLPLADIVSKKPILGVTLDDDTYNEKTKSKVQATFKKADYEATTEEESDEEEEETTSTEAAATEDDEELEELEMDDL